MLSFAWVLESVGYDRLVLEAFAEPRELLRPISGTTAIFCDRDDDDVRTRSPDGRSRGLSPSVSSLLEADERVLRDLELLCRSRSFSLSRSRSLLLGELESFLLRRRCVSDELMVCVRAGGCASSVWLQVGQAKSIQRGYGLLR